MQCPKCQRENFEADKPCPQCGFQGDADRLAELGHLQWLLKQMDQWEKSHIGAVPVSKLKEIYTARLKETKVALGLRLPSFTPKEAEKAWTELARLESLFEKVDEWRNAGYFKVKTESLDPVKTQRAHADELRQRLEEYQRPELPQTDEDRLKTVSFLLDQIDLLAAREWFKSKKAIEKVVAPITAVMIEVMSDNESE
jgi:hypothetical protein